MKFELPDKSYKLLIDSISRFQEIERAFIFGSRAMGNCKKGSDVDIAIKGEKVTFESVKKLSCFLNEKLPLPYHFDIVHYETIENEDLKNHINEYGVCLFERE